MVDRIGGREKSVEKEWMKLVEKVVGKIGKEMREKWSK